MIKNKIAPHPKKFFWLVLLLIGPVLIVSADYGHSEMVMDELSEIQDAVFHLSPRGYTFDAETDKTDQYIDLNQADFFIEAAKIPENLEVDGNYPYRLVDHEVRDNDLEITLDYAHACSPYPYRVYLSRDDIFKSEYIDKSFPRSMDGNITYTHIHEALEDKPEFRKRLNPPGFFQGVTNAREPYHHQRVDVIYFEYTERELSQSEALHKSPTSGEDCINGYMLNGHVRISGHMSVWVGDTHFFDQCSYKSKEPKYTGRCDCSPKPSSEPAGNQLNPHLKDWNFPVCPIERKAPEYTGSCDCSRN